MIRDILEGERQAIVIDEFVPLAAAVIKKDGKILIARRKRAFMGYLWEFPWNRPGDYETLQEGLKRGVKEDLGIDLEVGNMFSSSGHVINCQLNVKLYAYEAEWISGEFSPKFPAQYRSILLILLAYKPR